MSFSFYKYQATGNDFIIIDNRLKVFDKNDTKLVAKLCNRRIGIGADGLILLESDNEFDFGMVYFNADGNQSTMCGNGGRCIASFAKKLNVICNSTIFLAIDGTHEAKINNNMVELKMNDVSVIKKIENGYFINTGSPHYVILRSHISKIDVQKEGGLIRNNEIFKKEGVNVNFVEIFDENRFFVRTYERGIEAETLSCGTGATAVAIAMHACKKTFSNNLIIETRGGKLEVNFSEKRSNYSEVWLSGPCEFVFKGVINKKLLS